MNRNPSPTTVEVDGKKTTEPQGFIVACKGFFGFKAGQTMAGFRDEMAELPKADREQIRTMLIEQEGYNIRPIASA